MPEGVTPRHSRSCAISRGGERCTCAPTFQAQVWDSSTGKRPTKTFDTEQDAIDWRSDRRREIREGLFRPGRVVTIRVGLDELFEGMRSGLVRTRSGKRYKASTIRNYEQVADDHLKPNVGSTRVLDLRRADVGRLVGRLMREGLDASTVRNALMPLRVVYRRAIAADEIAVSPVAGVELPAVEGKRLRIAPPAEAAKLLAALKDHRAIWATAMYAGLRLGELQALLIEEVDLATGRIHVEANWDRVEQERVPPKSEAGRRRVPIPAVLRDYLDEYVMSLDRESGFIFGRDAETPFAQETLRGRAARAWKAAKLNGLTPHDCRHSYASLMIAAGVNAKALSTYMGHANISITLDRYSHLMPGNEEEAGQLLDDYLDRANTKARRAAVGGD
jgi:integrase